MPRFIMLPYGDFGLAIAFALGQPLFWGPTLLSFVMAVWSVINLIMFSRKISNVHIIRGLAWESRLTNFKKSYFLIMSLLVYKHVI